MSKLTSVSGSLALWLQYKCIVLAESESMSDVIIRQSFAKLDQNVCYFCFNLHF